MTTIYIPHPFRDITYQSKNKYYFLPYERQQLQRYRAAHDEAWQLKQRFETAKGAALLAQNELNDYDYDREELEFIWENYVTEIDFTDKALLHTLDIRAQVELRDFYLEVRKLHERLIKFYDKLAAVEAEYKELTKSYLRQDKPLDPLNFTLLDDIFKFHEDRETDIESLDQDLQAFLQELTAVYAILDTYVEVYSALHTQYGDSLHKMAQLMHTIQQLDNLWD